MGVNLSGIVPVPDLTHILLVTRFFFYFSIIVGVFLAYMGVSLICIGVYGYEFVCYTASAKFTSF